MDYENDIQIDESALDVEWLNQAALAMKYGKHWAECQQIFQKAEEEVKLIRSSLIRKATDVEGRQPTGPVIEAYYRSHKTHIAAKKNWAKAQYELNVAEIAKKEISVTRKAALQNLVELHGQQYFSSPNMPRDLSHEVQRKEKQKASDIGVAKKMRRKK